MKQSEADRLAHNLITKFGLSIKATVHSDTDDQYVLLAPTGIHPNEGFHIKVHIGWRSLYIELIFGKFAAELLKQMANSTPAKRQIFSGIAYHIINEKGKLTLTINENPFDPLEPCSWQSEWESFSFVLQTGPLEINTDDHLLTENLINTWVERFYGCIIAICPLEEFDEDLEDDIGAIGMPEGTLTKVLVNRYERNRFNRSMCINFHGSSCSVCGINFGKLYGSIGQGFIHVHHIIPVSSLGPDYLINPINDLIPVCPNCHAMLHKRYPPFSIQELKDMMNKSN